MENKDRRKESAGGKAWARPVVKPAVLVLLAVILLCGVLAGLLWWRRHGADEGVAIRPEREHPVGIVETYCQKDQRWAEDKLGSSVYRMRGSGCLTSCVASALSTQAASGIGGTTADTGKVISAGELNRIFSEGQVYNEQGDIVWDRIGGIMPEVGVLVAGSVDGKQIEALLDEGKYPIVKVKVGGDGAAHWVLIVGSDGEEYVCVDPLKVDGARVPLSVHGGVVYRMRCVYWAGGGSRAGT